MTHENENALPAWIDVLLLCGVLALLHVGRAALSLSLGRKKRRREIYS